MCAGGAFNILKHNNIRNIISKAVREIGLRTQLEPGGVICDQRSPGDVTVRSWCGGRHLLVDVRIINPLALFHSQVPVKHGVGSSATAYENSKRQLYTDLDDIEFEFVPFVVETC